MIRYEIEKSIMEGTLKTSELKDYWNAKYKEYLGIEVPSDKKGVLQDIHWSHGSIGYFPTYSLGSFYAAQFFEKALKDIPNLNVKISKGDCSQLLKWLAKHSPTWQKVLAREICTKVTRQKLSWTIHAVYQE